MYGTLFGMLMVIIGFALTCTALFIGVKRKLYQAAAGLALIGALWCATGSTVIIFVARL
jgi:uncharacterized membrane protein